MNAPKTIEQIISQEGKFVCTTSGKSMKPLFDDRRDVVIIFPKEGRLKKYDVPLYKRGDSYVLHRIVKVLPDSYVICGDNCESYEYGIREDDIIGKLFAFYRKGKYCTADNKIYKIYSVIIVNSFFVRIFFKKTCRKAKRLYRKIFLRK